MTPEQVAALAASGESEILECKATTGARREAAATLCAMLNHRGGRVLFGTAPDGQVVGQQVSERTVEELSAELGRIDPPVFPDIERIRVGAIWTSSPFTFDPALRRRTATGAPRFDAWATRRRPCRPRNTTEFCLIASTATDVGKTR